MTMADWITKLDDFLRLGEREILTHAGKISHEMATAHAETQFDLYRQQLAKEVSAVERDFDAATKKLKTLEAGKRSAAREKPRGKSGDKA